MAYKHGVYTSEVATSMVAPITGTAGLQVIVGTAPVNMLKDPAAAVNVPLLVSSYKEAVEAVGYLPDFANYTLCECISANFSVVGIAPMVLINVLDPAKHKIAITGGTVQVNDGVAVLEDGRILYEGAAVNKLTHSVSLMPMVEEALNKCSTDISEIELYAAVVGPGSFTGVRIGVSAVKGMAHGAGKPCVAVNALEALAWGVSLMPDLICPIQDARAGQVYGAAFQPGRVPQRVMEDTAAKLEDYLDQALVAAKPEQKLCFLGDGVERYRTAIEARLGQRAVFAPAQMSYLRPAAVAALAWQNRENAVDYLTLQPHYLRAPQAERARAARLAAEGKA